MKKNKILIINLFFLVVFLFFFIKCFSKEVEIFSIDGDQIFNYITSDAKGFHSKEFPLSLGVYQVRIHANGNENNSAKFGYTSENETFNSVKTNVITMSAGVDYIDYEIYILDVQEKFQIYGEFEQASNQYLQSIALYRTTMGERILCTILLAGYVLCYLIYKFRKGIIEGTINKEQQIVVWILSFSVLLSFYPLMVDYFKIGADTAFHMTRIEGLKETILLGNHFPIRVQSYWMYDHGYAVSTYYGDLFLWFPAILRIIGFSLLATYRIFVFFIMVGTALIAYYSFYQCSKHRSAALFGSVLYMLAPYRIYNVYNRGAMGEYLAMMILPLIFTGIYRLYRDDVGSKNYKTNKIFLIVGLTALLQSHLLSTEIVAVIIIFVCLFQFKKTFRKETFRELTIAAMVTLLINAWFWMPLLLMMTNDKYNFTKLVEASIQQEGIMFARIFQFYPNAGTVQNGMYSSEPIQMGIAAMCMFILYIFGRMVRKTGEKNKYDKETMCFLVMTMFFLFLSTKYFPWDFLSSIKGVEVLVTAIQFPTRIMAFVTLFFSVFGMIFIQWLKEEGLHKQLKNGVILFILLLAILSAVYHVNSIIYTIKPTRVHSAENIGTLSVVNGEYLLNNNKAIEYYAHGPVKEGNLEWSYYEKKGTSIRITVENLEDKEVYLQLPLTGYVGYGISTSSGEENVPYITEQRGEHEDLRIAIPVGFSGEIYIEYMGTRIHRIGEIITLLSFLIIGIYLVGKRRRRNG